MKRRNKRRMTASKLLVMSCCSMGDVDRENTIEFVEKFKRA